MSKTLLRAIATAAVLIAALPVAAFATSVDLSIYSITGSPDPITLGTGNVTYSVGIYNSSTTAGTNVVLTNALPASSTYVSSSAANSGTCSQSSGTVTCSWASIPGGSVYFATIVVTPTAGGPLTLSSSVTGTESDPNTINNSASKAVIVDSQIDLGISSMTVSPDPITLGTGDVQFFVQFTNYSTSQATNAVLTSTIPVNSTFVSATTPVGSGSCSQSAGTVTCNWASIPAGGTYYAYITVTPTAGGVLTLSSSVAATQSDSDTSNNSGSKSVTVNSQIDLGISSMTVTPDPMTLGTGTVQFLVQYTNGSTSQATNVVLTSTLPTNSTFVSATTPVGSGTCSQSAGTVTCNWATIGPGSTYYAYITVNPTAGGSLSLTSTVSAAQSDPNTSNNTGTKASIVNSQIDLGISSMTVSPDPMTLGTGDVQFLVQYTNNSTSQATNAVLTSTIPVNSTFVSATTPVGSGTCSQSAGTVTCNWATIPAGTTYYAYITVTPTAGGVLTLSSSVSATQSDSNTTNNTGSKAVTVNSQIDLGISSMTVSPDPMTVGTGDVQFLVQYTNNSTSQATNVVLTSTLPTNSTFVSATTPVGSGTCSQSAGTVTCNWATIAAGSTFYAYITVTPTAAGSLSLTSTVSAAQSDPDTTNNTGTKASTVNSDIDLSVSNITGSPDPITLGTGNVLYTVYVFNNSGSQATNVVLTSTLPAGTTFVSATTPVGSGTCNQSSGTVTCNWASLPAGNTYYAFITVTPTANGVITLAASVAGAQTDSNATNNSASKAVTVGSTGAGVDLILNGISATPDPITLNTGNVTYTVQVYNSSSSAGTNPVLTATLPTNSTFVSASATNSGSCSQSSGTVTCNWTSIGAFTVFNATIVVTPTAGGSLSLTASVSGADPDPITANNSGNKTVTVNSKIDLQVYSVSGTPDPITLNTGNVTYTVQVYNPSLSQGTNTVLTNTLPANSTFVSASATGSGTCTHSGTVNCTWTSIPASTVYTVTIVVTPTAGGPLTLTSSVSGTEADPNTANNSASKSLTVNSQIDLRLYSMSATPDPITLNNGNVTYTVSIYNPSTSQGTNTVLTNTLPANSTFVSASATNSGTCTHSGTVTCNWATIPASGFYTATIVVTPTSGGSLTLSSSVAGTESDPNTADNSMSHSVTVNSQIDLQLYSISGTPDPLTLNNGNVTYTVSIYNASTSTGTNTVLTNTLPANSTFVSASATNSGTCSQASGTVTCNWTSIPSTGFYSVTIVVTPTSGGALTLSSSVAGAESDSNTANNSASHSVTVNSQIDLRVYSITATPDPITLNTGNVTYTVSIYNSSSSLGTNTVLTNTLPANSTFVSASATNSGTCTHSGATVTCNWASIPSSGFYSATIVVTPTSGGSMTLAASVAGTESDPNTADNSSSHSVTVNSQIDLQLYSISGTPDPLTLNTGNVTYSVLIYNASSSQGTGTVLTSTLPSNSTFVSATATNGGSCSQSSGTVTCNWTSIPATSLYSVTIVVTPTAGGPLTIVSNVAGTETDSNPPNNSANKSVTVNSQIDLAVYSITGSPNPITFGAGNVTFTGYAYNQSSSQGTNVVLTNTLPSNSTYVSSSASNGGTCSHSGSTVTCSWTSIPATTLYPVTIVVTPTIPGTLTLSASVSGTQPDPNTADNTGSGTTTVNPTACTAVPSGAVAWYRAESNTVDAVGPNNGTINGGVTYTTGNVGQAFNFNGTTGYISVPDNTTLHPSSLTIEGWAKFTSIPSTATIASKTVGSGTNDSYVLWYQGGALHGTIGNTSGNGPSVDYTWTPTTNTWYHIAYTYDSGGQAQALYVNGSMVASGTNSTVIGFDTNPLIIGAEIESSAHTFFFPGLVDELTLYSRALTQTEVQTVYGAGTFGKCYTAPATPAITGFTPASGSTGTSVVISGTNFIGVTSVLFNGTSATYTVNSTSQITATVPAGATSGFISVGNDGGVGVSGSSFTVPTAAHWINSSGGNWSTGANWSTGSAPGSATDAIIDATGTYTVTLDVTPAFSSLTVGGGASGTQTLDLGSGHTVTFTNAGTVTSSGALTFASGTLTGAGGLTVNGVMNWSSDSTISTTVSIGAGGTLNMPNGGTRYIDAGTLNNSGTINWSGTNNLSVVDSGVINNQAGGLFSVTNNQIIYQSCCTAGQAFNNQGTFRKTVATGTTTINNNGFNNTGTVDIQSGTFTPSSGGTSSGIINATSSGTFLLSTGTYTIGSGGTLTGSGNFQVGGGTLAVNATGVTVDHLTMSGGFLSIAGSVSTSATGVVDWISDSTLNGTGSLTIVNGGTLNIPNGGTRYIDGATLNNSGTVNWSGTNNLSVVDSGVINNLATGLFNVTNNQIVYQSCCTAGQAFNNQGTFRKSSSTGTTTINNNGFNNTGTLDIQSGTFSPSSGGTSSGIINAASSGTFLLSTGTYTIGSGGTLTGTGNFQVGGGTLVVNATGVTINHLTMSGGTLSIAGSVSTSATGIVDWISDSTITGAGSLSIVSGGTLNIPNGGTRYIDAGTLNNSGTVNWSGTNNLSVVDSGVINNQAGGLFSVTNNQIIYQSCCTAGQAFNNAGTFRKTVATGTTTINNNGFNNTGTVDIQSGTFTPSSGGTSSGIINAASSGTFLLSTGTYTIATGGTLTGTGNFQVGGGTLAVNATGVTVSHLTMSGGFLSIAGSISTSATGVVDWISDSTLNGTGSLTIVNGGTLNIPNGGTRYIDGGTLNNSGTVNWSGTNNLSVVDSGVINNQTGGLFNVTNDQIIYQSCCTPGQAFNNQGTFLKTTATGTTTISNNGFANSGTLQAHSGVIAFSSAYTSSGSPVYDFGIGSLTTYGRLTFANPVSLTGALVAAPINSFVPQGGWQFQVITFPSGTATFSPKTLTYGSSPTRSFIDTYPGTSVLLTASGPTISSLSPNQGPGSGGTAVTITGTGFASGGSLGVTFGGNAATSVSVVNSTTITCTTPAHASGVVDIALTNGDGQPTILTHGFTYDFSPVISSIRPSSGSTAGAGGVIIDGTNLDTVTAVDFGGSSGTIIYSSPTELTAAAPAHAAGTVNVTVTNPVGPYTLSNGFTYIANDDPARDFFVTTNPSARWSYGYENTRGAAFVLYPTSGRTGAMFDFWNAGSFPNLGRNSGTATLVQGTDFTPAMSVQFHPGPSGENSVFRWTAPATGTYRIHGDFVGLDNSAPTTSDVAILHNNSTASTLFSAFINAYNVPQSFDVSQTLAAGDTIEFTVGFGQNGNNNGDATGLDVSIDPVVCTVTATISGTTSFCTGGSTTLTANPSGGSGTFVSYQWLLNNSPIGGATASTYTATAGGSYSVTVTDSLGCSGTSAPTTVTVNAPPPAAISAPASACANSTVAASIVGGGVAGATYTWSVGNGTLQTGQGTPSITFTVGMATPVSLSVVASLNGCPANGSASITVGAFTPTITASGPTSFCAGGSVTLTSSSAASYQWLLNGSPIGGANAQSYVASASGNYSVSVTNGAGCSGTSATTTVTQTAAPSPTITPSGPTTFCSGGSVTLTSSAATSYQWLLNNSPIGGATASTYNATAGGSYSVTVTNSFGCTGTSAPTTVTVNAPPPAAISAPASVCSNSTVAASIAGGGVAGATYTWSVGNGTLQTGQGTSSITFTVGTATPVSLSVVASLNGCPANGSTSITVGPFVPTITGPTSFCPGGSVTLTSSSGTTYQWLLNGSPIGGANAQSYIAVAAGNYSVTVTSGTCSGTSATTTVTQLPAPSPTVTPSGPTTFCNGGSVTLTSSVATSYQWLLNNGPINGATGQSFTATLSGSYSVKVTNGSGCSGTSAAINVSSSSLTATIFAPSSAAPGSAGNLASVTPGPTGSTYAWSITGGTITGGNGTTSITWTAGGSGNAVISLTVTNGSCSTSGSATVTITGAADLALTDTAAPNPVNPGSAITFTVNVANNGPGAAQNIVLTDTFFGVTAPIASGNGWSCTTSGVTVTCTMPSLPVGPAAPVTITATASAVSSAGDGASVSASTSDPDGSNNNAGSAVVVNTQPSCNNAAPSAISPAAGASNVANPVSFTWSAAANATSYDLWIASAGTAPAIVATTQSTSATVSLPSGTSTWYVDAHFAGDCPTLFSTPRDFTIAASANCSHPAPQLIAPSPNAAVNSPVTFSWTPVAQAVAYRLWIALDGGGMQDVGTTNGATSLTLPLTGSSVIWHVDAIFPGCDPTSSAPSAFTIVAPDACAGHSAPTLLAPSPNATLASSVVDFHWTAVTGANGYRLWTSINGGAFAPFGTTASATTLHATFTSGTVAWYVEALFNGCASIASAQQSFTIPAAASCNNSAATSLAPSSDATLTNGTVDFTWSPAPNAIGYELWLSFNNGTPSMAGTTTATTLRISIGAGGIEWFVRAQFSGCDPVESAHARFTYTPPADCSLLRPILTAPVDGAPVVITPFDLHWSNVPGATQYKVWVASGDAPPAVIGTTSGTELDNQSAPEGNVTWFVDAIFDSCPSLRSTSSTFTAAHPLPPCSTPGVPLPRAESTASTNVEYLIRWTPSGPAATTQYEVQESLDASFTSPASITTDASEWPFKHVNSSDAPIAYYYRVRSVGTCTGERSLFSLPLTVQVLPSNVTDPASANGSTPADNPQTTHYEIHIGSGTNGSALHKGAIAAAVGETFTATTNQPWLTVSPSSGTVSADGTTLTVTATTNGLPVGTSSGAVNINFGNANGSQHGNVGTLGTTPPATTTVSVNLVQPVSPTAKNAPPPDALIIPAVAHADGINSKFQSDIRVTNSSAQPMKYQVTFTPTGDTGITQGKQTTVDIDPGHTIALDDVLQSWFGSDGATGTLEVRPLTAAPTSTAAVSSGLANILTFAASRTYNTTANGTFGQYIPAIPFAAFVGRAGDPTKSTILSLQQIAQSPAYRTNLGIVEGSGDPASVLISVFGDNGQKLTEFTQDLKGGQQVQLNSILALKNVQVNDGRIEVKVVSPVGKVTAYASVLDNRTNDPLLVPPVAVNQAAASMYVIPGVADLNNGIANWQSDVRVFNPSTSIVKATLTYYSQSGGTPLSKDISLAPGQVQTFDGALQQLFGISNDGGALHIATTATTPLVATARTYNQTANGTYGQFIPAVTANDAAALGTRPLQILQIEESDRYRTNVGVAEVTGNPATIEVTAIPSDSKVAASTQIDLAPNQFVQYPQLLKSMGLTNMYNARVTVKVIAGQGRVTAYASVIDMQTNDPTFVPAQ